jgi:major membrane immunogen (membrane-anchored lipoprotein)
MKKSIVMIAATMLLAACGERAQTIGTAGKQDAAAYNGTGKAFVDAGWKQGDKTSWESHLRARGQNSQNEYSKIN